MIKNLLKQLCAILCTTLCTFADLPEDPAEYHKWEARMLEAIADHASQADDLAIQKLSGYIQSLTISTNREPGDRPVLQAALHALTLIPDHTRFLESQLERFRAEEIAYFKQSVSEFANSDGDRRDTFRTLGQIPSPEVVALLGKLVKDTSNPLEGVPRAKGRPESRSNSDMALLTLDALPIIDPPVESKLESYAPDWQFDAARERWQVWFDEVESGIRTYRFEGDPRPNDLKGVATAVRSPTAVPAPPPRRTDPPAAPAPEPAEEPRPPWPVLAAALAFLVAGLVWWRSGTGRHKRS